MTDSAIDFSDNEASVTTLDAVLRSDLAAFVRKAFGTVSPGDTYLANWHIRAICYELEKVMRGETKRLIITMPPRYLKSICASVAFPAWVLGHDPTQKIICVSYAQELAVKHANDCRAVMTSSWYDRVFPATKVDDSKNTETEFMTTERGYRLSTSVGGVLTGRGGNIIIVDDPTKPADGMSEAARARAIEWFCGTLLSRLNDKERGAIIVVMQRLHQGDLVGHLLGEQGWRHLNLPAIAELEQTIEIGPDRFHTRRIGDLLHPERESRATLEAMKRGMGSAVFAAQYQQSPVPPGGNMVNWAWFNFYNPEQASKFKFEKIVISWDTAIKASELCDYSVGTVWGVDGFGCFYLLDVVRDRLDYPALKRKVKDVYNHWRFTTGLTPRLLIEDAGSGFILIQDLRPLGIHAYAVRPVGDKVMRLSAVSAVIESGAVLLPARAPWLEAFRTELLAFPQGVHDDQVDSMSQALNHMANAPVFFAFGVGGREGSPPFIAS
jgi:predicted phage terminase large subunit-like protein